MFFFFFFIIEFILYSFRFIIYFSFSFLMQFVILRWECMEIYVYLDEYV